MVAARAPVARVIAWGAIVGLAAASGGVLLLRRAWGDRSGATTVAGWAVLMLGAPGWMLAGVAADKAIAFAALGPSLCALAVLTMEAARTRAPLRLAAVSPRFRSVVTPSRPANGGRGLVRALCVGPLSGMAALAIALAADAHVPGGAADKLVAADFVTPLVWACAAVWAATDPRLARVSAGLSALAAAALTTAIL